MEKLTVAPVGFRKWLKDPKYGFGRDQLTGTGNFANPDFQATWNPHVLDQCQKTGMSALVKTIELAAPKQRFVIIVQGSKEPFWQFVEKLSASLEKEVEDENLRALLLKQLAKSNSNADCRKLIEALPGDPSLPDIIQACTNVGTTDYKMAALAMTLQSSWKRPKSRQQKQWPQDPVELPITGLGGTVQCFVSQQPVLMANSEGQSAIVRPYVTEAIANLWGQDVLAASGVQIGTNLPGFIAEGFGQDASALSEGSACTMLRNQTLHGVVERLLEEEEKRNKCKTTASMSTQTVTEKTGTASTQTVTEEKGTKNKATVSVSTQAVTEEKETKAAISISTQTVTEAEQPKPVAVSPVQKKKSKSKSVRIVTDEDVAGPSHPTEETEPEIITRSLSLGELRDLRREFTRQTNESILTWLLRIWDAAANDTILDGSEARQLGSLSRDVVIDQGIGRTQQTLSLWQ
ncbi:hypothetical protein DUI87_12708 [Hirundo rustica rustica]|uniref:Retroviral nucleocapsid Gag protein p24 C-terminal domain-containing protein n=1 Tax=Hirundo rustica rustica TaxID=333673 RepID=A0A3M0KBS1_HIRRU|nr:hypothetical protein DUI87_12708 [Hirundo rustica rustica]